MINLLLTLVGGSEFNSTVVQRVIEKVNPDRLYMIITYEKELPLYQQYGECLLREKVARGIYDEKQLDLEHSIPLEDDVIQYMNQYSMDIIYQQRRFEMYPDFQISESIDSHYTVYKHNLFFWYNFLKRNQITHVFISAIPHEGYDCMIYYLCRYLQIPRQMLHSCFIPFRRYPLKDFAQNSPELEAEYRKLLKQFQDVDIAEIPLEGKTEEVFRRWSSREAEQMKPWYMRTDPFVRRFRQRFYETNIFRIWRGILGEDYVKHGLGLRFWAIAFCKIPVLCSMIPVAWHRWTFARPVKKKSVSFRKYYRSLAVEPVSGERYIYFPLQYQPEATSNPMGGGMYADQLIPLQILSRALPEDMKIYVKIHPEQLSLMRTKQYYDEIASVPGVRLITVESSTYELMKNAAAVACLTGTALWECQFFGVPALAFGYSVKNMAPLTHHIRTVEDCKRALEEIAVNPRQDVMKELKIYTKAMHNISFAVEDIDKMYPEVIASFVQERDFV